VILFTVSLQITLAWFLREQEWYIILPAAWLVGTIINHSYIGLLHDASHGLIFRGKFWNDVFGLIVNAPMLVPFLCVVQKIPHETPRVSGCL
jgi:sphingolipid delta-4 desaturase